MFLYLVERLGLPQKRHQYSTGLVNTEVPGEMPAARLDRPPRVAFPHPADKVNCPYAPVAQMDRAADFESVGREFEPPQARQNRADFQTRERPVGWRIYKVVGFVKRKVSFIGPGSEF